MRERRAVSSFFLERLTFIKRLPGGCEDELVPIPGSFSMLASLVLSFEEEPPLTALVFEPAVFAFISDDCYKY